MGRTAEHCKALIKDYCANCSFAGIHYIADETKHWIERIIWLILVILAWYGTGLLIISAVDSFRTSPISFVAETNYLNWKSKMPAVAICEISNDNQIYAVSDEIWTPQHLLDLEDVLRDIAYYKGTGNYLIDICYRRANPDANCPKDNFRYYADLVRSDCTGIMANCTYNGKEFDCCEFFRPIDTELGTCYIINSIQIENPKPFPMVINISHSRASLHFDLKLSSTVFTLGEDEVPTLTTLSSTTIPTQLGYCYQRQLTIRNIDNDPLLVQTRPEKRSCYFYDENQNNMYPMYSYSSCTVSCRKRSQLAKCGCNDHFMIATNEQERCNITGLACLHKHRFELTTLKPHWASRSGLSCSCLPSCDESEITVIKETSTKMKGKANRLRSHVEVVLAYLATERFKRSVVRSRLDLVVSVGGTAGLFVGASLLSFVELIFYFTIRFISNIMMEKRKQHYIKS